MTDLVEQRITFDAKIPAGKPIIRGMRLSVEMSLELLAQGASEREILEDYPQLEPEDLRAVLGYAHRLVAGEEVHLTAGAKLAAMRFLADPNAGGSVTRWLRAGGHDVIEVADQDTRMEDDAILDWAVRDDRMVITTDPDFEAHGPDAGTNNRSKHEETENPRLRFLRWLLFKPALPPGTPPSPFGD